MTTARLTTPDIERRYQAAKKIEEIEAIVGKFSELAAVGIYPAAIKHLREYADILRSTI